MDDGNGRPPRPTRETSVTLLQAILGVAVLAVAGVLIASLVRWIWEALW